MDELRSVRKEAIFVDSGGNRTVVVAEYDSEFKLWSASIVFQASASTAEEAIFDLANPAREFAEKAAKALG